MAEKTRAGLLKSSGCFGSPRYLIPCISYCLLYKIGTWFSSHLTSSGRIPIGSIFRDLKKYLKSLVTMDIPVKDNGDGGRGEGEFKSTLRRHAGTHCEFDSSDSELTGFSGSPTVKVSRLTSRPLTFGAEVARKGKISSLNCSPLSAINHSHGTATHLIHTYTKLLKRARMRMHYNA